MRSFKQVSKKLPLDMSEMFWIEKWLTTVQWAEDWRVFVWTRSISETSGARDGRRWRGDKWDGEMEINNVICVRWRLTKQSQDVLPQSTLIMKTGLDILSHYQHAGALSSPSLTIRQRWADVPLISSRLLLLGHIFINSVGTLLLLTASALQLGKYLRNIWARRMIYTDVIDEASHTVQKTWSKMA